MTAETPTNSSVNLILRSLRERILVKLLLAFLVLVVLAIVVGVLSIQAQNNAQRQTEQLIAANRVISTADLDLAGAIAEVERLVQNYVLVSADPERLREAEQLYFAPWETEVVQIQQLLVELEQANFNQSTIDAVADKLAAHVNAMADVKQLSEARAAALQMLLETEGIELSMAENGLETYQLRLLTLVQLEKAFIVTAQEVFANDLRDGEAVERQFRTLAGELRAEIELDADLPAESRGLFLADFDRYVTLFNELADSDRGRRLKTFEVESATGPLKTLIDLEVNNLEAAKEGQESTLAPFSQAALDRLQPLVILNVVIAIFLAVLLIAGISRQIEHFQKTTRLINGGQFDARVEIVSQDEIGVMAQEFNTLLDNTVSLIQSRDEKEQIQIAIMSLLQEVSDVAEGDLTVHAQVDDNITGDIAASFNFMVKQLRNIILQVQTTANRVSTASGRIQTTAEYLADGSATQSDQIVNTSAAVDEMSISIQQVSESSAQSAVVSAQARNNAREGAQAVDNTIRSMAQIQDQIESVASSVNDLRFYSEQIGEIVSIVNDLADRTSVLAINATIRAMAAGEIGRGFAVVAREVESLAAETTEATQRVSAIIKTIQQDTARAVTATELAVVEVRKGSQLATEAGQRLAEIESVALRLAELIQGISIASQQQARSSETVARSMNDIALVTQQTAAGTREASTSIQNLTQLADRLRASASTFRITGQSPVNAIE